MRVLFNHLIGEGFCPFPHRYQTHEFPCSATLCCPWYLGKLVMCVGLHCVHLFTYHRGTTFPFKTFFGYLGNWLQPCTFLPLFACHQVCHTRAPSNAGRTGSLEPAVPGHHSTAPEWWPLCTRMQRPKRNSNKKVITLSVHWILLQVGWIYHGQVDVIPNI